MDLDFNYKELFHASPCGYAILSKKNKFLKINQTLLKWLKYQSSEELEGKFFQEILSVADKIYFETHFYPLILIQKNVREINLQLERKDGTKIPVLIDGKLTESLNEKEPYFLLSFIDITQRKSYENELKKSKSESEKLANSLNDNLLIIEKEVAKAENVQKYLLPKPFYSPEKSLSIDTFYLPLDRVSGDIYDFFQLEENKYRFFLADATGHGLSAGFQTMSIHTEYQRIKKYMSPSQILRTLNASTFQIFHNRIMIYTCFIMDLDLDNNKLEYVSAGHPTQILYSNNQFHYLETTTTIVGFKKEIQPSSQTVELGKQFTVLMYSDGIEESISDNFDIYGVEKIQGSMERHFRTPKKELFSVLMEDLKDFMGDSPIRDDISLIKIQKFT